MQTRIGSLAPPPGDVGGVEGGVLGLLGPNGAGKTTAVSTLTTLTRPDGGRATVAGHDGVAEPDRVRRRIGLSGQYAAVDDHLTGFENRDMIGRLYQLGAKRARARSRELLERFSLTEAANRPVGTYSGGMRRRLDLAAALVAEAPVLFLDEPTTGLDPRSRTELWAVIGELVERGATLLLTTQYMEEADQLADDIVVIDHGRQIAHGSSDQLKVMVGGDRIEVTLQPEASIADAHQVLSAVAVGDVHVDGRSVHAPVAGGAQALTEALRALDAAGVGLRHVGAASAHAGRRVPGTDRAGDRRRPRRVRVRARRSDGPGGGVMHRLAMAATDRPTEPDQGRRAAVVVGRTVSDVLYNVLSLGVMSAAGLLVGWRIHDGLGDALLAFGLLLLFAYAVSWVMAWVGLLVPSPEVVANASSMVIFPLTLVANAGTDRLATAAPRHLHAGLGRGDHRRVRPVGRPPVRQDGLTEGHARSQLVVPVKED